MYCLSHDRGLDLFCGLQVGVGIVVVVETVVDAGAVVEVDDEVDVDEVEVAVLDEEVVLLGNCARQAFSVHSHSVMIFG